MSTQSVYIRRAAWASCLAAAMTLQGAQAQPAPQTPSRLSAITDAKARDALERALKAYAGLKTYQDTMLYRFEQRATLGGQDASEIRDEKATLRFERAAGGPRLALTGTPIELYSAGDTVRVRDARQGRYMERKVAPQSDSIAAAGEFGDVVHAHPVLEVLTGKVRSKTGFPGFDRVTGATDETLDGVPVVRIVGEGSSGVGADEAALPTRAWLRKDNGLLVRMEINLRPLIDRVYSGAPARERLVASKALITMSFTEAALDAPLDAGAFAFTPAPGEQRVEQLGGPERIGDIGSPEELIGSAAPPFTATLLSDGREVSLGDFRGQVVVLFFWATWSAPCAEMLPALDRFAKAHADKGVVVLAVNQDLSARLEAAKARLADLGVSVPAVSDTGGTTGRSYGATRLPLTFVVDRGGVVRHARVGASPEFEKELGATVDPLLSSPTPSPQGR